MNSTNGSGQCPLSHAIGQDHANSIDSAQGIARRLEMAHWKFFQKKDVEDSFDASKVPKEEALREAMDEAMDKYSSTHFEIDLEQLGNFVGKERMKTSEGQKKFAILLISRTDALLGPGGDLVKEFVGQLYEAGSLLSYSVIASNPTKNADLNLKAGQQSNYSAKLNIFEAAIENVFELYNAKPVGETCGLDDFKASFCLMGNFKANLSLPISENSNMSFMYNLYNSSGEAALLSYLCGAKVKEDSKKEDVLHMAIGMLNLLNEYNNNRTPPKDRVKLVRFLGKKEEEEEWLNMIDSSGGSGAADDDQLDAVVAAAEKKVQASMRRCGNHEWYKRPLVMEALELKLRFEKKRST